MTQSSYASTATPPKLETELGSSDFGDLAGVFDAFGKRKSQLLGGQSTTVTSAPRSESPEGISPGEFASPNLQLGTRSIYTTPPPGQLDPSSSPYSWTSHASNDGLISTPSPGTISRPFGQDVAPPVPQLGTSQPYPANTSPTNARSRRPNGPSSGGLRRRSAVLRRSSIPIDDEDATLVDSMNAIRALDHGWGNDSSSDAISRPMGNDRVRANGGGPGTNPPRSNVSTYPVRSATDNDRPVHGLASRPAAPVGLFDAEGSEEPDLFTPNNMSNRATPRAHAQPNRSYRGTASLGQTLTSNDAPKPKVMTPAQFERYRQQRELSRTMSDASKSEGSDGEADQYDDEDETERNRRLAKQRRKQEAHLAVYRQQMMKMTGEQPSELPNLGQTRPSPNRASMSTPNLLNAVSSLNLAEGKPAEPAKTSDDEDEDVPLGILAAHGFPHKNRPPTRLSVMPNMRSSTQLGSYPPPPASVSGDGATAGARSSVLPAFARNLPQDPYFGAGLVNQSNRESLAFGGGGGGGMPSGGLVGVIAGEERARAIRRGSPHAQTGYGSPLPGNVQDGSPRLGQNPLPMPNMGQGSMMGMPGMGPMGGMPAMTPGDQAQIQMSQQMQQMMQMQMEWMQQMMRMQGMPNGQQPAAPILPAMGNLGGPAGQSLGPTPMGSQSAPNTPGSPQLHQRTMSMLDPGMSQWNRNNARLSQYAPSMMDQVPGQGYAPSLAPSERSNVGMPTRYRPVSTMMMEPVGNRASARSSGTLQEWSTRPSGPPTLKVDSKGGQEDDDDEEGWEEMKAKREKKKSTWKLKKAGESLKEAFIADV